MARVHFLNVGQGDCTLIEHDSGRISLIDICKGNYAAPSPGIIAAALEVIFGKPEGEPRLPNDFGMSKRPTNPLIYLKGLGITSLSRFILTHPDMDHMDGFEALWNSFEVLSFWDSGVRKQKPDFHRLIEYREGDWDRYAKVRDGRRVKHLQAGDYGGDRLYAVAPGRTLVAQAKRSGDVNDASYVLVFKSRGGRIVIPGDAHDGTWDYVIKHHRKEVENCSVLFAPHHGRKSARSFEFLNVLKPKITLFGCATSGHLAYGAWSYRKLPVLTNNQAGNIVLECGDGKIDIYVENAEFARACSLDVSIKNQQGYVYYHTVKKTRAKASNDKR